MPKINIKTKETGEKILSAALELFRSRGFEETTMRDIAAAAGVATGAAYYYYPSKEALVTTFYEHSCAEMQPKIQAAVEAAWGIEERLKAVIRVKLDYFTPHRNVLRALLKSGADPKHPLSPFAVETKQIREIDIAWFRRIITDTDVRIPRDLAPHLPEVLWMFQMGVVYFWITEESVQQARTGRLLELGVKTVAALIKFSGLPLTRPLRKVALELIEIVRGA